MIEVRVKGEQGTMSHEMQLLLKRLQRLPRFVNRHEAGYVGFKGSVLAAGDRLGVARLEFTNEALETSTDAEEIEDGLVLYHFQGDATLMSEFDFEVANSGLRFRLPSGAQVSAVLPQSRSLISMSPQATAEYGVPWSVHSLEVWTPPRHLPQLPSEEHLESISLQFSLPVLKHWGNLLVLLPRFEGRVLQDDQLGRGVEASIEYDSRLVDLDELVLVREIREAGHLWDHEFDPIAELSTSSSKPATSVVKLKDIALGKASRRYIAPIPGDGGTHYHMRLGTRSGQVIDARTLPLVSEIRFGIEVHSDTAIRNASIKSHERFAVDPNAPWKARIPRDYFLGRPGVWLTQADTGVVDEILGSMASRVIDYVKIVDPYLDAALFDEFVYLLPHNTAVRLIGSRINNHDEFIEHLDALRKSGHRIEVLRIHINNYPSKTPLHDRFVVTRDAGWYLGTSFNSLASNASLVAEVTPADAKQLERQFDDWWENEVMGNDGEACSKEAL